MIKVLIEKIEVYDLEKIISFIEKAADEVKLFDKLTSKKILIKPNLLGPHIPEKAVTTHPVVVEALIQVLQKRGLMVSLGDSPGGNVSVENLWEVTGMKALADKYKIPLLHFGEKGVVHFTRNGFEFVIDKQVTEFSAIINLSKYKTHSLTMFTGAVKNMFGVVPGLTKSDYHRLYPQPIKLGELLVNIFGELRDKIVLNIMDGIVGMEGEGPSSGSPRNFGVMFASASASALDYTAAGMFGYNAEAIPMVKMSLAEENITPADIEVSNEWKGFVFHKVKIGKASISSAFINKLPPLFQKVFFRLFDYYPEFNTNCVYCYICLKGCPVQAISDPQKKAKKRKLLIDKKKCIKCLCCQEFCPHKAIYLKKTLLARFILR